MKVFGNRDLSDNFIFTLLGSKNLSSISNFQEVVSNLLRYVGVFTALYLYKIQKKKQEKKRNVQMKHIGAVRKQKYYIS